MPNPELSVVLPAYNEELRIQQALARTLAHMDRRCLKAEVLVVNGNPPGWLTVVNTDRPRDSVHLTRSVFPDDPQVWGLRPVLATRDEILVAHTHPKVAKVYRVSRTTGEILGTFAEGVVAREMIQIEK